jgi:ATPase subunit of ABC transporter with duplicated ATPase domains
MSCPCSRRHAAAQRRRTLGVAPGERVCLIGRNGSGKSTLLKIVAGIVENDGGSRFVQPGATVQYLPQEPDFSGYATTLAYVEAGMGDGHNIYQAQYLLEQLGLTGHEDPNNLSGGEARRTALARVLAPEPISCCSTSPPTISISRRSNGWKANWPAGAARWC